MPDLEPRLVEICFLFFFCFLEQRSLFMHVVAASVRASEMGSEIQALALGVPVHCGVAMPLGSFHLGGPQKPRWPWVRSKTSSGPAR